ncbi:MAG: hypothetical protein IJ315_02720 [Firmicutes bacterium]|nr:hypothetical protein [Bacillota bacterium]
MLEGVKISFSYSRDGEWIQIPDEATDRNGMRYEQDGAIYECVLTSQKQGADYVLSMDAPYPTQLRMFLSVPGRENYYHVIPCNIYGDNNKKGCVPGELPFLAEHEEGDPFTASRWEFRADRAATPLSALTFTGGAIGIAIDPYSDDVARGIRLDEGRKEVSFIHNGVFAQLPDVCGVSLGYVNDPVTYLGKKKPIPSTQELACKASCKGTIYLLEGEGRTVLHEMIRAEYPKRHERARHEKDYLTAIRGMIDSFTKKNWDNEAKEYTNMNCRIPENPVMKPWRLVCDIGWCGGGVLAYPLVLARKIKGAIQADTFEQARCGEDMIDHILKAYNEKVGLLYNYTQPRHEGDDPNGGWLSLPTGHSAYMMGTALHYILKSALLMGKDAPEFWIRRSKEVLDELIALQREDGAFGFGYSAEERKVIEWNGFAGCWFAPAAVYLWKLCGEEKYLESAKKALRYYHQYVAALNCYGTPMDTRQAVDEEGNLAFIRGSRLVYEYTGEEVFLQYLKDGAEYEYLWRYSYKARPECPPLNDGEWNSCGGAVTSVSNPHIHPMGLIVDSDLRYLARVSGDVYHQARAEDSIAWAMQNLERYPEKNGYGWYGMMSERWCPSDGLLSEHYSDGSLSSTWFSYNLWAPANALEAIEELYLEQR